jgi:branched-chain amino acid transport system permease protein
MAHGHPLARGTAAVAAEAAPVIPLSVSRTLSRTLASRSGRVGAGVLAVLAYWLVIRAAFDPSQGALFRGFCTGTLYGLIGVGLVLIYKTNRIINFAAAGLGAVPGIGAALLIALKGWSFWVAFPMCLVVGGLLGAITDILIVRRFREAPRLILTVATIGISQIMAYAAFRMALGFGTQGENPSLVTPFTNRTFYQGNERLSADYLFAVVTIAIAVTALTLFLRFSRMGIALRASAENADRAALLGIPVRTVQTISWMIAGVVGALVVFLRASVVGIPGDGSLGPTVLLFALAAAVIGRMESIPTTLVAGIGIGILADAVVADTGSDSATAPVLLGVVLVSLLLQRGRISRALDSGVSTWQAVREFRPVPPELARLPEVRWFRAGAFVVVGALLLAFPHIVGEANYGFAQIAVISGIVAVSLVILTGWAGQISLGQFGIVGVGAAIGGRLAAEHNLDMFLVLLAGALAGAVVAILVGLPALRIQGLYLAVTTFAFAAAMELYFLQPDLWVGSHVLPDSSLRIRTPVLWNRVALGDGIIPTTGFYYFCLAILGGSVLMARAYRRNRAGRAIVAVRENSRAASSYSVSPATTKLAAFAVSGALAAIAGVLFAYQAGGIDATTYGVDASLRIFVITVIGGLTSISGAVLGTIALEAVRFFGEDHVKNISLLVTGPGLLLVLLALPGGFAEAGYRMRDWYLRKVAARRGLDVPSLVADRRIETGEDQQHIIEEAEHHVEEVDSLV